MENEEIFKRLEKIPHLSLDLEFDLPSMLKELENIDVYVGYQTNFDSELVKAHYARAWKGRTLTGISPNSKDGIRESTPVKGEETAKIIPTDLAIQCTNIMRSIRSIGGDQRISRIMKITPGESLRWHNHVDNGQTNRIFTVHIPLVMPDNFTYVVADNGNMDTRRRILLDSKAVHAAKYPLARPTIFNSLHYHNVFNPDQTERISLMMYCTFNNAWFKHSVIRALTSYDGPLIQEYIRDN